MPKKIDEERPLVTVVVIRDCESKCMEFKQYRHLHNKKPRGGSNRRIVVILIIWFCAQGNTSTLLGSHLFVSGGKRFS